MDEWREGWRERGRQWVGWMDGWMNGGRDGGREGGFQISSQPVLFRPIPNGRKEGERRRGMVHGGTSPS
jgi:hypothetical protein